MKKVLPIVLFAVITVLIGSVLFEKCNNNVEHKAFLSQVDSLHKVNDSLQAEIAKDDAAIDSLDIVAVELQYKVDHQKAKVIKIANKELNYKNIILNKDKEIAGWEGQYQKIELQYNKLKVKSKFQRIGSYIVIGGLAYLMLAK
jgi:hypothetical protein